MRRKLYLLLLKKTKSDALSRHMANAMNVILKCCYPFLAFLARSRHKENMSLVQAGNVLNAASPKPMEAGNKTALQPINNVTDLSVIIPAYNAGKTMERCLQSVLAQVTDVSMEIIVVNDGSTDQTECIIEKYCVIDGRLSLISQENKGLSGARNTGIVEANGQYLFFLDADDTLPSGAIQALMRLAKKEDADIVGGSFCTIYEHKKMPTIMQNIVQCQVVPKDASAILSGFAWGKVFKRCLFEKVRFPEHYLFEDSIMAFLIYPLVVGSTVASTSQEVYHYYKNDVGITATYHKTPKCIDAYWIVEKMYEEYVKIDLPHNE